MAVIEEIVVYLNGSVTNGVEGLDELSLNTSFINKSRTVQAIQPVLTVGELTFVGPAAKTIITYLEGGIDVTTPGMFEGMPLRLQANTEVLFNGFLNFKKYEQITEDKVICEIQETEDINSFAAIAKTTYFNILETKGIYKLSDYVNLPTVIERLDAGAEIANLELALFLLTITAIQQTKELNKDVALVLSLLVNPFTTASSIVYALALAAIDLFVFGLLVVQIVKLMIKLAQLALPPVKRHKTVFEDKLLRKAFKHLGYEFETNITEMANTVYLPAQPQGKNSIVSGLPKLGEVADTLSKAIGLFLTKYHARFAIIDDVAHLRSINDPFWIKNSDFILRNIGSEGTENLNLESERKLFNIEDFQGNRTISFTTDVSDEYTSVDFKGTNFMVITEPILVNNQKNLLFDGLDEVKIGQALGSVKRSLSELEDTMLRLLTKADDLVSIFGGNSNFAGLITNRIGALRLSQSVFNVPKAIYLVKVDGAFRIPFNHRDKLSARVLYQKYHAEKSFVNTKPNLSISATTSQSIEYEDIAEPNFGGQKIVFNDRVIPFVTSEYLKLKNNSYFATGRVSHFFIFFFLNNHFIGVVYI